MYQKESDNHVNPEWLTERAILGPKSEIVNMINQQLLD